MNSFQVRVVYGKCGFSDEAMEQIADAPASKYRASWMFSNSEGTTSVVLRVLADDAYGAVPVAGRALKAAERLIGAEPVEVGVITEVEAYRRIGPVPAEMAELIKTQEPVAAVAS